MTRMKSEPPTAERVASQSSTVTARLFDADRSDSEFELTSKTVASIGDRQLLWVDAVVADESSYDLPFLQWLPFDRDVVERTLTGQPVAGLSVHGEYFLARVVVLDQQRDADEHVVLDLAVAPNTVLTVRRGPVQFLADLNDRIRGDTSLGEIDSTDFATVLFDGLVSSYLELTDSILAQVDELDEQALISAVGRDLLTDLVALRHRIAAVRRILVAHRPLFAALAGADFQVITGSEAAPRFEALTARFNGAIGAIDTAREALLGTFDIHMSRTAQRTNDTVKILTIVSILLLPTGVIAGFMGMNIRAPYSNDDPTIFWLVIAAIVSVAVLTLVALRARRWL